MRFKATYKPSKEAKQVSAIKRVLTDKTPKKGIRIAGKIYPYDNSVLKTLKNINHGRKKY